MDWNAFRNILPILVLVHGIQLSEACVDRRLCELFPYFNIDDCCPAATTTSAVERYCGQQQMENSRIYGGAKSKRGELPWVALIVYRHRNETLCGGTVVGDRFVVTAAHCVTGQVLNRAGFPWLVRLGVQNVDRQSRPEDIYSIRATYSHPDYDDSSVNRGSDIALLELDRDIVFHGLVQPVCLPRDNRRLPAGTNLTVAGWGKTPYGSSSKAKLQTTMRVLDNAACNTVYRKASLRLTDTQFCTGGYGSTDTCRGDSGNGLFSADGTHYLRGIVSFGSAACGNERFPSISTDVRAFMNWMTSYTAAQAVH